MQSKVVGVICLFIGLLLGAALGGAGALVLTRPPPRPTHGPHDGAPFRGDWSNAEPEGSLTRLAVANGDAGWSVEAWGAGGGGAPDLPWGPSPLALLGDDAAASTATYGFAHWDQKFADRYLTLRREGDGLVAEVYTVFKDGSGRSNYHTTERFQRPP